MKGHLAGRHSMYTITIVAVPTRHVVSHRNQYTYPTTATASSPVTVVATNTGTSLRTRTLTSASLPLSNPLIRTCRLLAGHINQ